MGCSASKRQLGQDERNVPLMRSFSLPGSSAKAEGGSPTKTTWKSGSKALGTLDGQVRSSSKSKPVKEDVGGQHLGTQQIRPSSKLKPVKEEDLCNETASQTGFECMDRRSPASKKYAQSHRSPSFGSFQEGKSEAMVSPLSKGTSNANGGQKSKLVECKSPLSNSRASSFRVSESIDGFTGLQLLLSPVATPSRSFASSSRSGTLSKTLSASGRFPLNQSTESLASLNTRATKMVKDLPSQMEGMGDSEEVGSPLFDPSILATFEKAIEASSDDNWQGSDDATSSSCSRVGGSSLDTSSDAESLDCYKEYGVYEGLHQSSARRMGVDERFCKAESDDLCYRPSAVLKKKPSSKVTPLLNDAWVKKDYLQCFEVKCPPGCEDKIVLYFTSLRGIRKTFEDCCTVRHILKGFGVQVDERDVWMHFSFRHELTEVVGAVSTVPRLFVKGRYIGGVEDVKHLHEGGVLGYLVEDFPAESNSVCGMCGGVRFIPCTSCSGSCKLVSLKNVLRCPDCNENGLMMCPLCYR